MERAAHPVEERAPEPVPRDPDLPTVSDATVMFFAASALVLTLVALLALV